MTPPELSAVAIAEDDARLRGLLRRGLEDAGFEVVLAVASGTELLAGIEASGARLLIVDIGLPDGDGRDVVAALRARGADLGVLMLTAKDGLTDRLAGFHAGIDDYLTKPFALSELVVRLTALARRTRRTTEADAGGPRLHLDPVTHAAGFGDRRVGLTPTEYRLLARLLARPGEAVRRAALVSAAWPDGAVVQENTLDSYAVRLRRKLAHLDAPVDLATVRGVGYRLQ
ncbi:MAG TPA: response regulator transcription factor [Actinotalea sp.]